MQKVPCKRCGGGGQFPRAGMPCFGCNGKGFQQVLSVEEERARLVAWADELTADLATANAQIDRTVIKGRTPRQVDLNNVTRLATALYDVCAKIDALKP